MRAKQVADLLQKIHARHGLGLVQVADMLDVSLETVNRWRRGEVIIPHMTGILLYIIANADVDTLRKALDE